MEIVERFGNVFETAFIILLGDIIRYTRLYLWVVQFISTDDWL
jgi:hypothetical protein